MALKFLAQAKGKKSSAGKPKETLAKNESGHRLKARSKEQPGSNKGAISFHHVLGVPAPNAHTHTHRPNKMEKNLGALVFLSGVGLAPASPWAWKPRSRPSPRSCGRSGLARGSCGAWGGEGSGVGGVGVGVGGGDGGGGGGL